MAFQKQSCGPLRRKKKPKGVKQQIELRGAQISLKVTQFHFHKDASLSHHVNSKKISKKEESSGESVKIVSKANQQIEE